MEFAKSENSALVGRVPLPVDGLSGVSKNISSVLPVALEAGRALCTLTGLLVGALPSPPPALPLGSTPFLPFSLLIIPLILSNWSSILFSLFSVVQYVRHKLACWFCGARKEGQSRCRCMTSVAKFMASRYSMKAWSRRRKEARVSAWRADSVAALTTCAICGMDG
jgi:hypothetical protein